LGVISLPVSAFALDMEYFTFGGHSAIVSAFSRLALIFSDNGYKSLFASIIVLAIVFGGGSTFLRAAFGVKTSPIAWFIPILVGVVLYLGLVIPTGTLHIYDKTTNAYTPVAGIPDGIIAMAGILSSIENGLVEIVDTAADPLGYNAQAGGVGYMGLFSSTQVLAKVGTKDTSNFDASMQKYTEDCVSFELQRPGTTLTVEELRRSSGDLRLSLAKAASTVNFTTYYDAAVPTGASMTCANAYTQISAYLLTPANFDDVMKATCQELGMDPADAAQYGNCQSSIAATLEQVGFNAGTTSTDFIRQAYIAKKLNDYYRTGNGAAVGNYQFMVNASGTMKSANEWLPILRAVLTAVAVGMIPFLALFIPTPLFGKAIGVIAGFFIWLTAWGVTDAVIHGFAIDFANNVYANIRNIATANPGAMGMDAFYFMPDETVKVLAMFGTLRMSGLMLATIITGMLVKFGGHALSSLSGNVTGQIQSAGVSGAKQTEDASGRGQAISAITSSMPTTELANSPAYGSGGMFNASLVNQQWGMEGARAKQQNYGAAAAAGVVPGGDSGFSNFARQSQAADKVSTEKGILGFGTTPDGIVTSDLRSDHSTTGTSKQGWSEQTNTQRGEGGSTGTKSLTGAAGSAKYNLQDGKEELAAASVNGISGKLSLMKQDAAVREGAHSLSDDKTWGAVSSQAETDSKTSTEAKAFREAFSNSATEEASKQVANGSAFKDVSEETKQKILAASASIGLGAGAKGAFTALTMGAATIDAKGEGKYILSGKDGKSVEFSANAQEMEGFKNTVSKSREDSIANTLAYSEALSYASTLSESTTGKEGHSYIQKARETKASSAQVDQDMQTAYIADRAQRTHGNTSADSVQQTIGEINSQQIGPPAQQKALMNDMKDFTMKRYDGVQDGVVQGAISQEKAITIGQIEGVKGDAVPAGSRARTAVDDNAFKDPRQGVSGPDEARVDHNVAERKNVINAIQADDGGFDYGTNPVKQLHRDVASIAVPQPDAPDARTLPGKPGNQIDAPGTPVSHEQLRQSGRGEIPTTGGGESSLNMGWKDERVEQLLPSHGSLDVGEEQLRKSQESLQTMSDLLRKF
jgi:conjugal transfer mating pair stabilization protein TraG